ncbi:TATA element modulatory factor 1 [Homalodisca vitripennis]|nr:TATA element modulatory factor 1 [Homalodisca vitripennis]
METMSWFDATGFANLAKTALKEAQKTIDKALDIKEEDVEHNIHSSLPSAVSVEGVPRSESEPQLSTVNKLNTSASLWGSFTGSFFENPKAQENGDLPDTADVQHEYLPAVDDQDGDLPATTDVQHEYFPAIPEEVEVVAENIPGEREAMVPKKKKRKKDESGSKEAPARPTNLISHQPKKAATFRPPTGKTHTPDSNSPPAEEEPPEEGNPADIREEILSFPPVVYRKKEPRNYSNRLSAISSESDRRSSSSCEVLGSCTPDSEPPPSLSSSSSGARLRQSGSFESVEVLTSPSSVEVLGSSSSENRYSSDSVSPLVEGEDVPELVEDSEPSVAEDSYTSASETLTSGTVLDLHHTDAVRDLMLKSTSSLDTSLTEPPRDVSAVRHMLDLVVQLDFYRKEPNAREFCSLGTGMLYRYTGLGHIIFKSLMGPHTPASLAREPGSTRLEMDQIRQCMDNKEPSRVKFRRAEPDPPLLAVRLGSARLEYQFASVWRITDRTRAPTTEKSVHSVFTTVGQTLRTTRSAKGKVFCLF